jgi:hypothetical protein
VGNCPCYDVVHAPLIQALLVTDGPTSNRDSAGLRVCHRHVTQVTGVMLRAAVSVCRCDMVMCAYTWLHTRLGDATTSLPSISMCALHRQRATAVVCYRYLLDILPSSMYAVCTIA